jgi:hypothetical protein
MCISFISNTCFSTVTPRTIDQLEFISKWMSRIAGICAIVTIVFALAVIVHNSTFTPVQTNTLYSLAAVSFAFGIMTVIIDAVKKNALRRLVSDQNSLEE